AALKLHVRSDVRDLLRGHAPASITDREGELALRHTGTDAHRRAGLGELERIVRQFLDDLFEIAAGHRHAGILNLKTQILLSRGRAMPMLPRKSCSFSSDRRRRAFCFSRRMLTAPINS